jgi:hypothetical protein
VAILVLENLLLGEIFASYDYLYASSVGFPFLLLFHFGQVEDDDCLKCERFNWLIEI